MEEELRNHAHAPVRSLDVIKAAAAIRVIQEAEGEALFTAKFQGGNLVAVHR
jgi:hypothetical protein